MIDAHAAASQGRSSMRFIVGLRWTLLLLSPFMFEMSSIGSAGSVMWLVLLLFGLSNAVLHYRLLHPRPAASRWMWFPTFFCDIVLITAVVVVRGGVRTDTYLLYVLVACEAGLLLKRGEAWAVGLISLVAYAGAVFLADGPGHLDRVLIRSVYLGLVGLATTYLAASEKKALQAALTDAKTNLPNSRLFQEALAEAVRHHSRQGLPLAVAIVDVDNFRQLNAAIGHPRADKVLEQLAEILLMWKRPEDVIARYGGEEFVFLMPNCSAPDAEIRMDCLRARIADTPFFVGTEGAVHITISGGVTGLDTARTISALLVTADRALLEAKAAGKNRMIRA